MDDGKHPKKCKWFNLSIFKKFMLALIVLSSITKKREIVTNMTPFMPFREIVTNISLTHKNTSKPSKSIKIKFLVLSTSFVSVSAA